VVRGASDGISCARRPPDAAVSHLPGCIELAGDILAEEMRCSAEPASAQPIDPRQVIAQMVAAGVPDEIVEQARETIALASMPVDERRAVLAKRRAERGLREPLACSFCDSPRRRVAKLITGKQAVICDRCVEAAAATLD
jgi:hypothetical protein